MRREPFSQHVALIAVGISILASLSLVYFAHIQWLGFPDGYLTELDRAELTAFPVVAAVGVIIGASGLTLGLMKSMPARVSRVVLIVAGFYVVVVVVLDVIARMNLEAGGGG